MDYYLNYDGDKISFSVPSEWNVLSSRDCAKAVVVEDVAGEIERALDQPIGMPPLEEYARPGVKVAVLFDDMQRATPANLAIPAILNLFSAVNPLLSFVLITTSFPISRLSSLACSTVIRISSDFSLLR